MKLAGMRALIALLVVLGLIPFWPALARAHLGSVKYIEVTPTDEGARLVVDVERVDTAVELGLPAEASTEAILVRVEALKSWVASGVVLRGGSEECAASEATTRFIDRENGEYLRFESTVRCPGAPIRLRDDLIYDDDPQHEAIVRVVGGEADVVVLRRGNREMEVRSRTMLELFAVFLWQGVLHFAFGFDHVLFLLSLLIGTGFTLWHAREKSAQRTLRPVLKEIVWVVTAFTIGHSVTLVFAALEWVVLPIAPVEVAIAASIALVALWNLRAKPSGKALPWVGFGFGLIHGFGFSSVLAEVGLPSTGRVVALLAFNVGIELAQLAFVLIAIGPLVLLAGRHSYRAIARVGSVLIALLAAYWVLERLGLL